jgi:ribosomal protein S1
MTTTETPTDNSTPEAPTPPATAESSAAPANGETTSNGGAASAVPAVPADASHGSDSEGAAASPAESAGAEGEPPAAAEGSPSEGEESESGHDEETPTGAEAPPGQAAAGENAGEKKKRRRRRKKKPHEGEEGAAAAEARPAGEEAPPGAAPAAEAADENAAPRLRDKKKEKKHGPPRERPPVNAGDIVFGKIIEITDDAILIDIPGKSKAIFDRREMLLPEDDEPASTRRAAPEETSTESPAEPSEPGDTGSEESPTTAAPVGDVAAEASPTETAPESAPAVEPAPAVQPTPAVEPAPAVQPAPAVELAPAEQVAAAPIPIPTPAPEPDAATASEAEAPPPPREPKVPRVTLEVGADFIAVVHNDGARGGLVVLTHHPRRAERAKAVVERAFNDKTPIEGLVTGVIKGGVEVDVDGMRAFVPGSHIDMRLGADLSYLVAKRLTFLVTQYAKRGRDLVLSRRSMIEDEAKKARTEALARLKIGEELDGKVRSVVSFGAFIDVGGIEGLVPLQEMSHNRADGPSDVFKAGETVRVKVLKIDERGKIWLSHKATIPDPWQQVAQKYAQGTKHAGKVARLQPFGAFIELESGIDGLIHLADLSINRIESPSEVVKVGDAIDVVVSHIDASNHKIALHLAPTGDAANETPQRVQPHKPVKAKIVTIESGGLVVRILGVTGRNSRGYVTSAGTGTPRGTELRKSFKIGQEIDAKVIEMDPRRGEVKLSIKALSEEQERSAYQQYRQQLKAEARFTFADLLAKKGTPPQR